MCMQTMFLVNTIKHYLHLGMTLKWLAGLTMLTMYNISLKAASPIKRCSNRCHIKDSPYTDKKAEPKQLPWQVILKINAFWGSWGRLSCVMNSQTAPNRSHFGSTFSLSVHNDMAAYWFGILHSGDLNIKHNTILCTIKDTNYGPEPK